MSCDVSSCDFHFTVLELMSTVFTCNELDVTFMQLDACGLIGRCIQQFSQLSLFCSSICQQFSLLCFLGCSCNLLHVI